MAPYARTGFSKIEGVLLAGAIGGLALIAMPRFASAGVDTRVEDCAQQITRITRAFEGYRSSNGYWPPDTVVGQAPPEMRSVFKGDNPFRGMTPIGGQFDYDLPEDAGPICIVIRGGGVVEPPSIEDALALDAQIDDGDLMTGNFRAVTGGFAYAFAKK